MKSIIGASGQKICSQCIYYKVNPSGMYYIGSTGSLSVRLVSHNKGGSRFTKNKGHFILVYKEEFNTRSEAKKESII